MITAAASCSSEEATIRGGPGREWRRGGCCQHAHDICSCCEICASVHPHVHAGAVSNRSQASTCQAGARLGDGDRTAIVHNCGAARSCTAAWQRSMQSWLSTACVWVRSITCIFRSRTEWLRTFAQMWTCSQPRSRAADNGLQLNCRNNVTRHWTTPAAASLLPCLLTV